jgi:hypothetical protein
MVFLFVQWVKMIFDFSFCWWWNSWPLLFKSCSHNSIKFIKLLARINTLALNTTLKRMKLHGSPVCPYNATESLEHFLLECPAYKNIREIIYHMHVFMLCLDFIELSPLQKLQFFIGDTCYYSSQEWGDVFDRIGKNILKRMYVCRSSVLNIDWNIQLKRLCNCDYYNYDAIVHTYILDALQVLV